jgi:hypothetical protein
MLDILTLIPGRKTFARGGWHTFNAICCTHRGETPDKRRRGGVLITSDGWSYHCFNCHFKCGITEGQHFGPKAKQLLSWCGLDNIEIDRLSFESFASKPEHLVNQVNKPIIISFDTKELPEGAEPINEEDPRHQEHIEYIKSRGLSLYSYPYFVTPDAKFERDKHRLIIPYFYLGRIVGYTSRYCDNRVPKYVSEQQSGYIFNVDAQKQNRQSCILVEGQFDAISIDGCAYLGSTITDDQARLLRKIRKQIIVVPDRDKAGMGVCDRALELGYKVSIPDWSPEVKDVNDAVKRYGKFPTILSIIQSATSSRITTEMNKRKFK